MKTGPFSLIENFSKDIAPEPAEPKKRPRVRHRTAHFISSSLLELTDNSDLPSWIMDSNEENDYRKICKKESKLLSIKCKDGKSNIFGLANDELKRKITELTTLVTKNTDKDAFIKDDKVFISNETLTSLKQQMENLFDVKLTEADVKGEIHTKACAGVQLLSFLISLRLYREIKTNNIRLIDLPTEKIAIDDFGKLKGYNPKNPNSISMFDKVGNKAVDYFTLTERIKASKKGRFSAHDVTENKIAKLASTLTTHINAYYEQHFNSKHNILVNKDKSIDDKSIKHMLKTNFYVSQFSPSVLFNLISYLKQNFKFSFNDGKGYVLDPCGGWGGRAVACFAHSEIYHYTAIEPNQALTESYDKMYQLYVSDKKNKRLFTFNKKLEDVELKDLKRDNHEYDLAFTSPPYKDKEIYVTSGKEYADTSKWNSFLFKLLTISKVLRPGGLLVLNVSNDLVAGISEYKKSLSEFSDLTCVSLPAARARVQQSNQTTNQGRVRQNKEVFSIFRKEAGGNVRSSLIDFSPMPPALSAKVNPGIDYDNTTTSNVQGPLNMYPEKVSSYELLFSGLSFALPSTEPTPIDQELMLYLTEVSKQFEFGQFNNVNLPVLESSDDDDAMDVDEFHADLPVHNTDANKLDRSHQNFFMFGQSNNLPTSFDSSLKRKRLNEDKIENEKSDIDVPKKKKARRNPLETDTVEGKKAKDKIVYDFNRPTKLEANKKIKLQLEANKNPLALIAEIFSEEGNEQVEDNMDVYDDVEPVITSGLLLISFKTSLIRSALPELFESEKSQTGMSPKSLFTL